MDTPIRRKSSNTVKSFVPLFAEAHHEAGLGGDAGPIGARPVQQLEGARIPAARTGHAVQARHRFDVVVEDVRTRVEHGVERRLDALEVGDQHLDAARRHALTRQPDRFGEDRRAAVGQVVAIHRRDHREREAHPRHGFGHPRRFRGVELVGPSMRDRAIGARPRAHVAEDHERGRAVVPALPDVGAAGVLAHGVQLQLLHDALQPDEVGRAGRAHLQPFRLGLARAEELEGSLDRHRPS